MLRSRLLLPLVLLGVSSPAAAIHRVEVDMTFANAGVLLLENPALDARVIANLPVSDGGAMIVIAYEGGDCSTDHTCISLLRIAEDGDFVPVNGLPTPAATFDVVDSAAIDSQDRVVVVGSRNVGGDDYDVHVARLLSTGGADLTFNGFGSNTIAFDRGGANADFGHGVAIDAQDRVVVVGQAERGSALDTDFAIARLRANGTLDDSFGPNTGAQAGSVIVPFDLRSQGRTDVARAVAIGADGGIVVAGTVRDHDLGILRLGIARLDAAGAYDTDWCNPDCQYNDYPVGNGRRTSYIGNSGDGRTHDVSDVAVGDGGEVLIVGTARAPGEIQGYIQRFAYDGEYQYETRLDAGDPTVDTQMGSVNQVRRDQPASDVIVSGTTGAPGARTFFAQRLTYTLAPVSDWGGNDPQGSVIHFNGTGSLFDPGNNQPGLSRLDTRGRLLVAGAIEYPNAGGPHAGVAARLTSSEQIFFDGFED